MSQTKQIATDHLARLNQGDITGAAALMAETCVDHGAIPEAQAVSLQSGWPTPTSDISYRNRTVGDVLIFGVTPPYQTVQDYRFAAGTPLADPDIRERRLVAVVGFDVADKLFGSPEQAIGRKLRIAGREMTVKAVTAKKGRVLGQSFDGFALLPITTFETLYGRRKTTTVSVKMPDGADVVALNVRSLDGIDVAALNIRAFDGRSR